MTRETLKLTSVCYAVNSRHYYLDNSRTCEESLENIAQSELMRKMYTETVSVSTDHSHMHFTYTHTHIYIHAYMD